jgi:hypothetical protein
VDIAEFLDFRAQGIEERFSQGRQPHLKPIDVYPFTPLHTRSTEFAKEVYGSNTHIY